MLFGAYLWRVEGACNLTDDPVLLRSSPPHSLWHPRRRGALRSVAVWKHDPVLSARSQPLPLQQLRLLVWLWGLWDPKGWSGQVIYHP